MDFSIRKTAHISLINIDEIRLLQSQLVEQKLTLRLNAYAKISTHLLQRGALDVADFIVACSQIGGFGPCTVTDFDFLKSFGLDQTIVDTLRIGGIMRGLRTLRYVALCLDAVMLQHVNFMAINTWAISTLYPPLKQVGLGHSVHTAR